MNPSVAVVWVFLVIFVLSALIALASLPEWIRLEEYYKKKLFVLLILEVIGCIVGFGVQSVRALQTRPPETPQTDLRSVLISNASGWDSQEPGNMTTRRSIFRFERGPENKVLFVGETVDFDEDDFSRPRRPVVIEKFKSLQPLEIPNGNVLEFDAEAQDVRPYFDSRPVGIHVVLQLDKAVRGVMTYRGSTDERIVILTPKLR
jgi:hypothetical protein